MSRRNYHSQSLKDFCKNLGDTAQLVPTLCEEEFHAPSNSPAPKHHRKPYTPCATTSELKSSTATPSKNPTTHNNKPPELIPNIPGPSLMDITTNPKINYIRLSWIYNSKCLNCHRLSQISYKMFCIFYHSAVHFTNILNIHHHWTQTLRQTVNYIYTPRQQQNSANPSSS